MSVLKLKYEEELTTQKFTSALQLSSGRTFKVYPSNRSYSELSQKLFLFCPFIRDIITSIGPNSDEIPTFIIPGCSVTSINHLLDILTLGCATLNGPDALVNYLVDELQSTAKLFGLHLSNFHLVLETQKQDDKEDGELSDNDEKDVDDAESIIEVERSEPEYREIPPKLEPADIVEIDCCEVDHAQRKKPIIRVVPDEFLFDQEAYNGETTAINWNLSYLSDTNSQNSSNQDIPSLNTHAHHSYAINPMNNNNDRNRDQENLFCTRQETVLRPNIVDILSNKQSRTLIYQIDKSLKRLKSLDLKTKLNAMKLTDTMKYPLSKNKKFGEIEESATVLRCSKCSYSTNKKFSLVQHINAKHKMTFPKKV